MENVILVMAGEF